MQRVFWSHLANLDRAHRDGGVLTYHMPGDSPRVRPWIGDRLVWWPRGIPPGRRVGIVSSRLGSPDRLGHRWFALLRQLCAEAGAGGEVLFSVQGTTLSRLLMRCAELLHVPLVLAEMPRRPLSLARWLAACAAEEAAQQAADTLGTSWCWPAWVSPPLADVACDPRPSRDALLVAASDRIVACRVRRGGNVFRLLERRLSEESCDGNPSVTLIMGDGFVSSPIAQLLARQGSVRQVGAPADALTREGLTATVSVPAPVPQRIVTIEEIAQAPYLTHCTRGVRGPWPDQSEDEYLDDLVMERAEAVHTPWVALRRILRQCLLRASGRAIRGGTPVVCFTAVGVSEIPALHTFRAHRRRWDFEPYGISMRREWLERRGARPVVYGDESQWKGLRDDERPYFQRRFCGRAGAIDWSREREWRHPGDLDLRDLPPDAAFVFVPSREEADQLREVSRWPVLVLP